jgi:glycosyltransferase involved in cell wall biosynthesis
MATGKELLVVVPSYNEEGSIGGVIDRIRDQELDRDYEIAVVNDSSSDDTAEIAEEKGVTVLSHPVNLGGGAALRTGFKYARKKDFEYVICVDGDGQHDPEHMKRVLEPVTDDGYDLCIGSRYRGERGYEIPFLRNLGIKFYSWTVSILSGYDITDCTSGYRAISRDLFTQYADNYADNFWAIEATIWAGRKGYRIKEVPVKMSEREEGESHLDLTNTIRYPVSMVYAIFRAL